MLRTRHARHREDISGRKLCVHWFVGAVVTGISGLMLTTNAVAESTAVEFNIPAQPVPSALREYAQQAAVQLLASTQGLDSVQANAVVGRFDSQTALQMLLAGTGLQAEYRSDATVIVRRITEASVPLASSMDSEAFSHLVAQTSVESDRQTVDAGDSQTSRISVSQYSQEAIRKLEEIVVTGTQIRGTPPVGASTITLDREYIDLTGLATTQEILQSMPQNFGGGANEDTATVGFGGGDAGNFGFSSSVNLRGLGSDSTLLLLNGRRSAPAGGDGAFVDLNSVPTTAIERIEILPDGASAIYGSDAVGGVINVILRDDYEGAETRLRYAPGTSDIDEIQLSQVIGRSWDGGSLLLTYEYYDRSELKSTDRVYTADGDLTPFGGTNHNVAASNPGNVNRYTLADGTNQSAELAIPSGQDGTALTPSDLLPGVTNLQNIREGTVVLPEQTRNSVLVTASQELSSAIELFTEVRYSTREFESLSGFSLSNQLTVPSSNPFFVDPFGGSQNLRLNYSFIDDYGPPRQSGEVETFSGLLGAAFGLSNSWELEVYGSYNSEDTFSLNDRFPNTAMLRDALADPDPSTAFNPFGDGSSTNPATLAAIEAFTSAQYESELTIVNVHADGDLFGMPGGVAKLAIGAQFRDESLLRNQTNFTTTPEPVVSSSDFDLERDVSAAFAEIYLPLVTEKSSRPGIKSLVASIAARYEDYSDFGDTLNPKLGMAWSPVESLTLRSTVGTSFRAPVLRELDDSNRRIFNFNITALGGPPGLTNSLFLFGNSADLDPQEGTTWTAGFDLGPFSLPEFSAGVTYFHTEVNDLIQLPGNNLVQPFLEQDIFAPIITTCPCDPATLTALMNEPAFLSIPVSPDEVSAIVDFRLQNLSKAELSGLDLNLTYAFETDVGSVDLSLYASHLFEFKEQLANGPLVDNIDTVTKPVSLTLRGSVIWRYGGTNVAVFVNHIGDYTNTRTSPNTPVSSWSTWNLHFGYDFNERYSGFLEGAQVSLSVQNLFDMDPPFVDASTAGVAFDAHNANALGRFVALQLTKEWCSTSSC